MATNRDVYNLLATFRFGSVVVAVALTVVLKSGATLEQSDIAVATLVSIYSVFLIGLGTRLLPLRRTTIALLGVDSVLATTGILVGGGMDSPFLLYALLPILTAALLVNKLTAIGLALVPGGTVTLAHTVGAVYTDSFPWVLDGNYLTLVPLYACVCLGVALLPFYANLNVRYLEQMAARREEQRHLRAELHDKLAQSLSSLTMGLRQLRRADTTAGRLSELVEVSERSYAEMRELLDLLEAGTWEPTAVGTLAHLAQTWTEETGIPISSSLPDGDLQLPPGVAIALMGITREALTNVGKHSGATHVWVQLHGQGNTAVLSIRDDGKGFEPGETKGHGLRIMQERAQEIRARLRVTSEPGKGTEVQVQCPTTS